MIGSEEWRPVPGLWGYEASTYGRVRLLDRVLLTGGRVCLYKGRLKTPRVNPSTGYLELTITLDGIHRTLRVHQLVAAAFHGIRPNKLDVNHKDGIKTHNWPENLEYVTRKQNIDHAFTMGLYPDRKGSNNACSKLTEDDVLRIRDDYACGGTTMRQLSKRHDVSAQIIWQVVHHKSWKHVTAYRQRKEM